MQDQPNATTAPKRVPWNKGKLTGAKPPLRPKHVWSIRTKLQIEGRPMLPIHSETSRAYWRVVILRSGPRWPANKNSPGRLPAVFI